jgi:uncharacterized membrane protein YqjE
MAIQVERDSDVGIATLLGGIVQDARELFVEQMTLFQVEIKNDARRTVAALVPFVFGLGVILAGIVLLGFAGASFLCWLIPETPIWLAYVLVGMLTIIVGSLLVLWGKSMLATINPTPDTALKSLKENIQWTMKK